MITIESKMTDSIGRTTVHVGEIDVAGFGSERHAREVRAGTDTAALRLIVIQHNVVLARTSAGERRIVLRNGILYTRLPDFRTWAERETDKRLKATTP